MKIQEWLVLGAVGAGLYMLFKSGGVNVAGEQYDLTNQGAPSGFSGTNPATSSNLFSASTQTITPISAEPSIIFKPTSEKAPDRFFIAPGTNNAGVYDRYAQQSIRKETAQIRSIFGTPKKDTPKA